MNKIILSVCFLSLIAVSAYAAVATVISINMTSCVTLCTVLVPLFPYLNFNGVILNPTLAAMMGFLNPMMGVFPSLPCVGINLDIFVSSLAPYLYYGGLSGPLTVVQYQEICTQVGYDIGAVIIP